jgi:Peptidase family C50/SAP domain
MLNTSPEHFVQEPSGRDKGNDKNKAPSIRPTVQRLLEGFMHSKSFDLLRDIRRMACLLSLTERVAALSPTGTGEESSQRGSTSFLSFLLGASSCGTALECVMERSGAGSSPSSPMGLSAVSSDIAAACCNDPPALQRVESTLRAHLQISASGKDAVCFLAIEPCTRNLLVGRWDSVGSTIVALPVAEELGCLLAQWGACMEGSKALLHRTLDSALVAKWTEADKREWWAERAASDALLGTILGKLEAMLGAWSSILVGSDGKENDTGANHLDHETPGTCIGNDCSGRIKTVATALSGADDLDIDLDLNDDLLKALNALKVTELRQQLKDKSLSVVGKKSELISRLQGHRFAPNSHNQSHKICLYEDPRSIMVRSADGASPSPTAAQNGRAARTAAVEGRGNIRTSKLSSSFSGASVPASHAGSPPHIQTAGSSSSGTAAHTVLILDEVLQQIPWEVLPALRGLQCSRLPSLALLLHMLTRQGTEKADDKGEGETGVVSQEEDQGDGSTLLTASTTEVRARPTDSITSSIEESLSASSKTHCTEAHSEPLRHTWFAVDPEGNLPATRDTMAAFLGPYRDKYGWTGFIGSMPSEQAAK